MASSKLFRALIDTESQPTPGETVKWTAGDEMWVHPDCVAWHADEMRADRFVEVGSPVTSKINPLTGRLKISAAGEDLLLAKLDKFRRSPGIELLDFGASPWSSAATQNTCQAVVNPTGWHDGTACLEITIDPEDDAFAEYRMYFDATKQFDLNSDDGFAIELSLPDLTTSAADPRIDVHVGKGATSTAAPANRLDFPLFRQVSGTVYQSGVKYHRFRWDITTADAKAGPIPGYAPTVQGTGFAQYNTCNYIRFVFTRMGGRTIKFKRLVHGGKTTPCLVMGTDAAAFHALALLMGAYFAKKNWRGYINQYFGGGNGIDDLVKAQQAIASLYGSGWDFNLNDTVDRNLATAGLTAAQLDAAMQECLSKARGYGWSQGANIWIYNNNGYNQTVVDALKRNGFVGARAGSADGRFCFTERGIADPYRLPGVSWDQLETSAMTAQIDRVCEYGATMWPYWHNTFEKAKVAADGQTAVGAGQTPSNYATSNAAYCTPRGIDSLTVWWENLKGALDHAAQKEAAGELLILSPSEWFALHGVS